MDSFTLLSPAKINLGLHVSKLRDDGYHDIDSVFVAVTLCDELTFSEANSLDLVCQPPVTTTPTDNLVYKAAALLQEFAGCTGKGAKIVLTKRIPHGAGLGGGSSNAATALLGLNRLWNLDYTPDELTPLARRLGSDVPFFLNGPVAHVTGRGDVVRTLPLDIPWTVLVVTPDLHISTPWAYQQIDAFPQRNPPSESTASIVSHLLDNYALDANDLNKGGYNKLVNDFHSCLATQLPEIPTITRRLHDAGALYASLSGSGSAVFGLFTSVETATTAASALAPYQTYICAPMNSVEQT